MDPRALPWIYRVEGKGVFTNDPNDSGGPTWEGITAPAVVGLKDKAGVLVFDIDGDGDVDGQDIIALSKMSEAEREAKVQVFYGQLWARMSAGAPWPWSLIVFDSAVHHGPKAGMKLVQDALDVQVDGLMGPRTLSAMVTSIAAQTVRPRVRQYAWLRSRLFRSICNSRPKDRTFLLGWLNRVAALEETCQASS